MSIEQQLKSSLPSLKYHLEQGKTIELWKNKQGVVKALAVNKKPVRLEEPIKIGGTD